VIDLFEYIEINPYLSEHTVKNIFKQIMAAISYMHSEGLVHGDVKDENILIDENGKVKLIDFGSASCFTQKKFTRFLGTIQYASPEILRGDSSYDGPAAEVWALGCCLYTMLTGQIPFRSKRHALFSSFYPPSRPLSCSSNDLLLKMLEKDSKLRCSIGDILSHDWFK
jgi:protein-serine/threonine kinase